MPFGNYIRSKLVWTKINNSKLKHATETDTFALQLASIKEFVARACFELSLIYPENWSITSFVSLIVAQKADEENVKWLTHQQCLDPLFFYANQKMLMLIAPSHYLPHSGRQCCLFLRTLFPRPGSSLGIHNFAQSPHKTRIYRDNLPVCVHLLSRILYRFFSLFQT